MIMKEGENMRLTTDEINNYVDQYVHNAKHRVILRLRLLDGTTYEEIAEKVSMSDRQIKNIVYKYLEDFTELSR